MSFYRRYIKQIYITGYSFNNLRFTYLYGIIKCSRAHNSFREFCNGVPVTNNLWLVSNSFNALYKRESSFFNLCASSTKRQAQLKDLRNCLSFNNISYVVRIALNFNLFELAKLHSNCLICKRYKINNETMCVKIM